MSETISSLDKRLAVIERLMEVQDHAMGEIERKQGSVDARLLVLSGAGSAVMFILDHVVPLLRK